MQPRLLNLEDVKLRYSASDEESPYDMVGPPRPLVVSRDGHVMLLLPFPNLESRARFANPRRGEIDSAPLLCLERARLPTLGVRVSSELDP